MKIIIGLLTGIKMQARRDLCDATWVPVAESLGFDVVYLFGSNVPATRNGRELHLPCPDGYPFLPQRTREFCKWGVDQGADYLFKADDDTLVHPWRLKEFAATLTEDYVGHEPGGGFVGYASGGAGYFLSRLAAQCVAEKLSHTRGAEDKLVGKLLKRSGVAFSQNDNFVPWGRLGVPLPDNELITSHKMAPVRWMTNWRLCRSEY